LARQKPRLPDSGKIRAKSKGKAVAFPLSFLMDATMTAQIIDGKALAEELRQSFKARVEALRPRATSPAWWSFWSAKTRLPRFT
jgi:hypothetical protein